MATSSNLLTSNKMSLGPLAYWFGLWFYGCFSIAMPRGSYFAYRIFLSLANFVSMLTGELCKMKSTRLKAKQ